MVLRWCVRYSEGDEGGLCLGIGVSRFMGFVLGLFEGKSHERARDGVVKAREPNLRISQEQEQTSKTQFRK